MPKICDLTNQVFGLWKVISKTNSRSKSGNTIYKCLNTKDNKIYYKNSSYLKQFKDRKSRKITAGRRRKWIITKIPYTEKEA